MPSTLYRNGVIHSSTDPFAEALLVADGQVAWLGSEETVHTVLDGVDEVVDLRGALMTPAFVDAHVHVLETALAARGVDLSAGGGVRSLAQALDAVAEAARVASAEGRHGPLLGHGWDEGEWPEGRPPTRTELDRATGGAEVYLSRVDVHSAVVSTSLAGRAGCRDAAGWSDSGVVVQEAHHRARTAVRVVTDAVRDQLHREALAAAAAAGIASVHEHSGPYLDTREGLAALLALTASAGSGLPGVVGYRAERCVTADDVRELVAAIPGLRGVGGDLTVDGSLGSRTAALREPYADAPSRGDLHLTAGEIADHVAAASSAGVQTAFHVIGDRGTDEVLAGFRLAAERVGPGAVRAGGHRLEHAEMVDAAAVAALVELGVTVSAQPAFDAAWGGPGGMYARRLGVERAAGLNPLADLAAAGVPLAFGSDSPVTPLSPWAAVRAAVHHHESAQRISARAAFRAHTRGGWRAAGLDHTGAGEIRLGAPATLAVWDVEELTVQVPDGRWSAWSTDPRSGTPLLPALDPGTPLPRCLRTLREGVVLHDDLG